MLRHVLEMIGRCVMFHLILLSAIGAIELPFVAGSVRSQQEGIYVLDNPSVYSFLRDDGAWFDRRAILEFPVDDVVGELFLNFFARNEDRPRYDVVDVYAYQGNGIVEVEDWSKASIYIGSWTDYGIISTGDMAVYAPHSIDVSDVYKMAVESGWEYIGFQMLVEEQKPFEQTARYTLLHNELPSMVPNTPIYLSSSESEPIARAPIPEPSSLLVWLVLLLLRRRARW